MSERLWRVAVDAPLIDALTYQNSKGLDLSPGRFVQVPLGKRKCRGLVLEPIETIEQSPFSLRDIDSVEDELPLLPENYLKWIQWVAKYYLYSPGLTAVLTCPQLKKISARKTSRVPVVPQKELITRHLSLTEEQRKCVDDISLDQGFSVHLVFGVTGSGKTEVYLQLLEKVLAQGKSGLMLVPEISLTPQLIDRFTSRFGGQIAVLHSQLTDRERTNQWWGVASGEKRILIGARSALFCPIPNLGLIVVDEEHEPGYKQEEKLKYNGRDSAIMLAKLTNCPVVLGSATPSLESWNNALAGKYKLHRLESRVHGRQFPAIEVVDLRKKEVAENTNKFNFLPYWMSPSLYKAMQETLQKKDQVALFLNRRGMANVIVCPLCGTTKECPNCDINLTLHANSHLICHYCDYHENFKKKCTHCADGEFEALGLGTELVEQDLLRLFTDQQIARADRDEVQNRTDLENLIKKMEERQIDILVGTQMIAKGLDFPRLTLVGLLLADVGFNLPDFRSTERSFQLMTQMAGRSGRHIEQGMAPGQVIIQTYNPEHPSLLYALQNDYVGFAQYEIEQRAALKYPPLGRLVCFRIQSANKQKAGETAQNLRQRATKLIEKAKEGAGIQILGPAEAPLFRIRNQYRYQLLLKGDQGPFLNSFSKTLLGDEKWIPAGCRVIPDVDPLQML